MPTKVLLTRSQKLTIKKLSNDDIDDDDYGPAGPDELDVHRGYGRPKLVQSQDDIDGELSAYVRIRLMVARAKALKRFNEIQSMKA